jgi:hypothetical protein
MVRAIFLAWCAVELHTHIRHLKKIDEKVFSNMQVLFYN